MTTCLIMKTLTLLMASTDAPDFISTSATSLRPSIATK